MFLFPYPISHFREGMKDDSSILYPPCQFCVGMKDDSSLLYPFCQFCVGIKDDSSLLYPFCQFCVGMNGYSSPLSPPPCVPINEHNRRRACGCKHPHSLLPLFLFADNCP